MIMVNQNEFILTQNDLDQFYQFFHLINCDLIDNEFDEPSCHLEWIDNQLVWTWRYIRQKNNEYYLGTERWITPIEDWECWCWRKQKWKLVLNTKALPGTLEAIIPENRLCIVRANRFNHHNQVLCWNPYEKYWSIGLPYENVDEFDDTIKIWCKIPCGCQTWRWLYYPILDEDDKVLLRWSHVLRDDE